MLQRYAHLCASNLVAKMDEVRRTVREYTHRGRRRTVVTVEQGVASSSTPEADLDVASTPKTGSVVTGEMSLINAAAA
ncbi:hypothetical protein GPA27_28975 [Aromatoleum toluolicum]|uniref:hypothetical protein n=1 Tax=Aromatoleum toluolicum TaxID=90060 RepID=UPI001B7CE09F|nr:hypothetical protein [Aromatoleum toluolicum]MCQ6964008.1 hypothetical protein [Aromatoleum toluolicum]